MTKKLLYLLITIIFSFQSYSQEFDKLINQFKSNNVFGMIDIVHPDSISEKSIYKSKDFHLSVSEDPINIKLETLVLKNPFYTDDFDDWDDNYINFPKSFSVIYNDNLVSLFDNGKFVCHYLDDYTRNKEFEDELNSKRFGYHWVIEGELYAKTKILNITYVWNGINWEKSMIKIPLNNQPILLSDKNFIVYRKCDGEFGGTIFFFDRKSKNIFYTESTCANTVIRQNEQYQILAQLGHMSGSSHIKIIDDPRKLTKARRNQLINLKGDLGYEDNSDEYFIELDFLGIQFFSQFNMKERNLFLVHISESTFIAELEGKEIKIVNPLFNNNKYTHDPITKTFGDYTLINMDFYGIANDREASVMIINKDKITLLDWNENHSR